MALHLLHQGAHVLAKIYCLQPEHATPTSRIKDETLLDDLAGARGCVRTLSAVFFETSASLLLEIRELQKNVAL